MKIHSFCIILSSEDTQIKMIYVVVEITADAFSQIWWFKAYNIEVE